MLKNISLLLSAVFSPLIIPTYGIILALWSSALNNMPFDVKMSVVMMVAAMTFLLPVIVLWLMQRVGYISGFALVYREERFVPFVIAILSYMACWFYLYRAGAPSWLTMFVVGAIVAALIACIVTRWWKISIHTTSLAGMLAMICSMAINGHAQCDMLPLITVAALLLGAVGTARLVLNRHTLAQCAAGVLNGFLCVYIAMSLG